MDSSKLPHVRRGRRCASSCFPTWPRRCRSRPCLIPGISPILVRGGRGGGGRGGFHGGGRGFTAAALGASMAASRAAGQPWRAYPAARLIAAAPIVGRLTVAGPIAAAVRWSSADRRLGTRLWLPGRRSDLGRSRCRVPVGGSRRGLCDDTGAGGRIMLVLQGRFAAIGLLGHLPVMDAIRGIGVKRSRYGAIGRSARP